MERRDFIQKTAFGTGIACLTPWTVIAGITGEKHPELQKHKITKIEKVKFEFLNNMKSDGLPLPVDILPAPSNEVVRKKHFRKGLTKPKSLKELKAEATKYIEKKSLLRRST